IDESFITVADNHRSRCVFARMTDVIINHTLPTCKQLPQQVKENASGTFLLYRLNSLDDTILPKWETVVSIFRHKKLMQQLEHTHPHCPVLNHPSGIRLSSQMVRKF